MKKTAAVLFLMVVMMQANSQVVEVKPNGFFIRNKPVSKTTTPAELRAILGEPSRVSTLANIIWTYDKQGIYVYFNPADSTIKHITLDLIKHSQKFSPLKAFMGVVIVNKNTLGRNTTLDRLQKMKSLRFEKSPAWLYPAYTNNLKLYFEFNEEQKQMQSIGFALVFTSDKD